MTVPLFEDRPIAVIWDFDKTLIKGSMQWPLFEKFGVDETTFWDESNALSGYYKEHGVDLVSEDTLYLNHILSYVKAGKFSGLNNAMLLELGGQLTFYSGLPEFFAETKSMIEDDRVFAEHRICVEHYIVSTGLRQMILGSAIAEHAAGVWACEFAEHSPGPGYLEREEEEADAGDAEIKEIVYTINNTTKTRAVFEINKGVNQDLGIEVNATIDPADRRVPFENMIYIADGPSDVPVFSILNHYNGQTFAVYDPESDREYAQVDELNRQDRVNAFGPADYANGSQASRWIRTAIMRAAQRMVEQRKAIRTRDLTERVGVAPRHIVE